MRLDSDIINIFLSTTDNCLNDLQIKWKSESACTVVLASSGYPGKYEKGKIIEGLDYKNDGVKNFPFWDENR